MAKDKVLRIGKETITLHLDGQGKTVAPVVIDVDNAYQVADAVVAAYFETHKRFTGTDRQNAWLNAYISERWPRYDLNADAAGLNDAIAIVFENIEFGTHY